MRIEKRRFKLEGEVNPWVLLASGEVKHVDAKDAKGKKLGDDIKVGNENGIVIGKQDFDVPKGAKGIDNTDLTGSNFVQDLAGNKPKAESMYKKLSGMDVEKRNAKILNSGGSSIPRNPKFRDNFFDLLERQGVKVSDNAKKFINVYHALPNYLKGTDLADFIKKGYGI